MINIRGTLSVFATGGFLVALSVVGAVVVSHQSSPGSSSGARGVPALATSPVDFPKVMEATARQELGSQDLGPATVAAFSAGGARVAAGDIADATSLYVSFGSEASHYWKLFVGRSGPGTTPAVARCDSTPLDSALLSCDAGRTPEGATAITTVVALQKIPDLPGRYSVADVKKLTAADLPGIRIERNTRVFHPGGSMTSVTESVVAPKSLEPESVFSTTLDAMTELATAPEVAAVPAS